MIPQVTGEGQKAYSLVRKLPLAATVSAVVPKTGWKPGLQLAGIIFLAFALAGCGGGGGPAPPAPSNPAPTLTSISPDSATAGGAAFTLTVKGSKFISSSVVRWGGSSRTTTFVTSTQLTASISASDITAAGTVQVTVFNPAPGGGTSNALTFSIVEVQSLSISTSRLPDTAGGKTYDFTLAASGGIPPITWSLAAGSSLPTNLMLDVTTGRIFGVVTAADTTANFTVQASDWAVTPHTATRDLSILVRATPLPRNDTRAAAVAISNGVIHASISPYGDQDFYAFDVLAGGTVRIEIFARRLSPETFLDSALEIQDSSGNVPSTCRSPDEPRDPYNPYNVIDPTPDAFDDVCRDDDIELGVVQDPLLEFQPPVSNTFFVRIIDFRGDGRPDLLYDLSLSGAD